ncbi:dicarboxylate/amino acid:cation symporter [Photobacterium sp. 1_MG-2023]|uniref:dicarboxylate/amino acid:cation symporter n=1 Tax=Photobacterium sp. 1_MG-2023 TaxID=3062646 RepID=UPI0026E331A0|nr:cation:dicarboxylase symporter family transporter [Photobacterium sp. 1_MG-2023]MDO6707341.1 cation:dicarboxylase symporter family transporter [Photobacterium sp. 1_MG-2023]
MNNFLFTYALITRLQINIGPFELIKRCHEQVLFTLATTSCVATLPVSIKTAREKFGVRPNIANFCIPLGSQMNKDGNAILLPIVLIFTGNAAGIDFTLIDLALMTGFSILMTLGGGGIPGSGIIKIAVVAQAFHLPLEIVGIVAGIYRLLDMGITTLNCLGDVVIAAAIDADEKRTEMTSTLKMSRGNP